MIGGVVKLPGIVRDGVVVPQSNERLPEGTHVEIRLEPGDVPAGLKSEIEAWDKASDESWKWIQGSLAHGQDDREWRCYDECVASRARSTTKSDPLHDQRALVTRLFSSRCFASDGPRFGSSRRPSNTKWPQKHSPLGLW